MKTINTDKCHICETETDNINTIWGYSICDHCIMLAVECLKKEIEEFEGLMKQEMQKFH